MCGIAGLCQFKETIDVQTFGLSLDSIAHRGPDAQGTQLVAQNKIIFGHRRLSIIDLSERGKQPMTNEDSTIWITFNGEIYNYQPLQRELKKRGHVFRSDSDTEVLIHGYEEWGIDGLLTKIKGMFAFGLWDEKKQLLFLARDRFGIKPLYYYQDVDRLAFASEIKAIVADDKVPRNVDMLAVFDFFVLRFIPAPRTIWKEIKKLPPASYLTLNYQTRQSAIKTYWSLPMANQPCSEQQFQQKFSELLEQAVREHLISDVPVGLFLSGGYDSTTLAYLAQKSVREFHTFSIGFQDWAMSEHEAAQQVATQLGTVHHEKIIDSTSLHVVPNLSYYYDEPLGGSSFLPTYLVSQLTRENNLKVVLAGDGGDELLGGYKWHTRILKDLAARKWWHKLSEKDDDFLLRRYFDEMSWAGFTYRSINQAFDGAFAEKDLPDDLWLYRDLIQPGVGNLKNLQLLDMKGFMPEVILNKVDRASMANSIEVRVPFLDHELAELVMQSHESAYYTPGIFKRPLRDILKPIFPASILDKPKKGFGAPVSLFADKNKPLNPVVGKTAGLLLKNNSDPRKDWAVSIYNNWINEWT